MRLRHMSSPFHRVRYLALNQYREAWLRDAGVFIQLCPKARGTNPCPGYPVGQFVLDPKCDKSAPPTYGSGTDVPKASGTPSGARPAGSVGPGGARGPSDGPAGPSETAFAGDDPDDPLWQFEGRPHDLDEGEAEAELEDAAEEEVGAEDTAVKEGAARNRGRAARVFKDRWGYPVKVIVHELDVHQLGVAQCQCSGGGAGIPADEQLLRLGGLFPATQKDPKTCFTLRGLEYHQLDRLESKIAPEAMMRKLRRRTTPMHPSTVPVSVQSSDMCR